MTDLDVRLQKIQEATERYREAKAELMSLLGIEEETEESGPPPAVAKKKLKKAKRKPKACCGSKGMRHKGGCSSMVSGSSPAAGDGEDEDMSPDAGYETSTDRHAADQQDEESTSEDAAR